MLVKAKIRDLGEPASYDLPDEITLQDADMVILKRDDDVTFGIVTGLPYHTPEKLKCCQRPKGRVQRKATEKDLEQVAHMRRREQEAVTFCQQQADVLGLEMHVTEVEGSLLSENLTCHFTADRRVDFRQLVRDVGRRFRCHVLMHQVAARELAQKLCGIGPCGRTLCCSSFLGKTKGVSSQAARAAAPGVAHAKLAGACGKLMCCLNFEGGCGK